MTAVEMIVAVADNMAIGKKGKVPWHLSEDLRHFKSVTMGHPVIMGRRTFESIGRVLPGRLNVIVSNTLSNDDPRLCNKDVLIVSSLNEALTLKFSATPMIMGGAGIYAEALPYASVLHLTRVHLSPADADTFFPSLSSSEFRKIFSESHREGEISFEFETWTRI